MKIEFLENQLQKRRIKKETAKLPSLPGTLLEYRAGREGYLDMRAAVSVLMPLLRELQQKNAAGETFPALIPEHAAIAGRTFSLAAAAGEYRGVIYPGFSAPELYTGVTVGAGSDVYSAGAMLFYLMTGRPPENAFNRMRDGFPLFSEEELNRMKSAASIYVRELKAEENPFDMELPAAERIPVIPDEVIDDGFLSVLERAMAVEPDDRFLSVGELIAALTPYNTKAAILYPVLVTPEEEAFYGNLIAVRTAPRRSGRKAKKAEPGEEPAEEPEVLSESETGDETVLDEETAEPEPGEEPVGEPEVLSESATGEESVLDEETSEPEPWEEPAEEPEVLPGQETGDETVLDEEAAEPEPGEEPEEEPEVLPGQETGDETVLDEEAAEPEPWEESAEEPEVLSESETGDETVLGEETAEPEPWEEPAEDTEVSSESETGDETVLGEETAEPEPVEEPAEEPEVLPEEEKYPARAVNEESAFAKLLSRLKRLFGRADADRRNRGRTKKAGDFSPPYLPESDSVRTEKTETSGASGDPGERSILFKSNEPEPPEESAGEAGAKPAKSKAIVFRSSDYERKDGK